MKQYALFAALAIGCGATQTPTPREKQLESELAQEKERTKAALERADAAERDAAAKNAMLVKQMEELANTLRANIEAEAKANTPPSRPVRVEPDRAKTYAVPVGDNPIIGSREALVTVIRSYEYACPYCEKSRATMDELLKKYGKDVRVVYRNFVVHPTKATAPALAACAAHRQGRFKEMDTLIWERMFKTGEFDKQIEDPQTGDKIECWHVNRCDKLESLALKAGLNLRQFSADMQICEQKLKADMDELKKFAVSATPVFFINGRYLPGAQPVENFSKLVDEELAKAKEAVKNGTSKTNYYEAAVIAGGEPAVSGAPTP